MTFQADVSVWEASEWFREAGDTVRSSWDNGQGHQDTKDGTNGSTSQQRIRTICEAGNSKCQFQLGVVYVAEMAYEIFFHFEH